MGNSSTNRTCNRAFTSRWNDCTAPKHGWNLDRQTRKTSTILQAHLHCGNEFLEVENHYAPILSTENAADKITVAAHLQCRTDSCTMIRDPAATTDNTVSHQSQPQHEAIIRRAGTDPTVCKAHMEFHGHMLIHSTPLAIPFTLRERSYSCKSQWNSIGNSSTSTTCNPIYIAGTILQLQITMEFCRPQMHEKHLKPHLQCGTDPTIIRP